jgi:hypothetical protein
VCVRVYVCTCVRATCEDLHRKNPSLAMFVSMREREREKAGVVV